MALPSVRRRSPRSRARHADILPDIVVVPPLRRTGAPLTLLPGRVDGTEQNGKYPLSARASASSSMYSSARFSNSATSGFSVPLSARESRGNFSVGSNGFAAARRFPQPIQEREPPRSALPGLFRDRSWASVNPEQAVPATTKRIVKASRWLVKGTDPTTWIKELECVDKVAEDAVLPNARVTALALDVLSRFADVLPAQQALIAELLHHVEAAIYPHMYTPKKGDDEEEEDMSNERESSLGSDTDSSGSRSSSEMVVIKRAADVARARKKHGTSVSQSKAHNGDPWHRYKRKLTVHDLVQDQWFASVEQRPGAAHMGDKARRTAIRKSTVNDGALKLKMCQDEIPKRYTNRMPFFFIDRKQRWEIAEARDRLRWMHDVCTNIEGRQRAQNFLFDILHELLQGNLLAWFWAYWKAYASEVLIFQKQVTGMKSTQRIMLARIWHVWCQAVSTTALWNTQMEETERIAEVDLLNMEVSNSLTVQKELLTALDVSDGGAQRMAWLKKVARDEAARLHKQFDTLQPQLVKQTLHRVIDATLDHASALLGASHVTGKALMLSKDFSHLLMHDDDSVAKVGRLPCEDLLIRWANHLLSEVKYCAADLLEHAGSDVVNDKRSAWSSVDSPIFNNRCRRARAVYLVENLGDDLRDGTVLTALYAMIRAHRLGHAAFDPVDLWPLDVRDPDAQAAAVCTCLHALAPTRAAKCLLRKQDIARGNKAVLVKFLAALFLVEAPGLPKGVLHEPHLSRTPKYVQNFGEFEELQDVNSISRDEEDDENAPLINAYHTLYNEASAIAYEPFEDLTRLLRSGETMTTLSRLPVEDVLIRWVNCLITGSDCGYIKNMGVDLRDGRVLLALLRKVAPDILAVADINVDPAPESAVQAVVECGPRCVDPCGITEEAVTSGHEDVLMGFVGSLFLARPCLETQVGSPTWLHMKLVVRIVEDGQTISRAEANNDNNSAELFRAYCKEVKSEHARLQPAVQALLKVQRVMENVKVRVETFVSENYTRRAKKGLALAALATAARRGSANAESSSASVNHCIDQLQLNVTTDAKTSDPIEVFSKNARDVMLRHADLLQRMYKFYCVTLPNGESRMPLVGIMRIYGSCRLACPCVGLPARAAEAIYYDVLDQDLPAWRQMDAGPEDEQLVLEGLSIRGFIRWVLRIAMHQLEEKPEEKMRFHIILAQFFERHIKPNACHPSDDEFFRIAYGHEIQAVFMPREFALWAIFQLYSTEVDDVQDQTPSWARVQDGGNTVEEEQHGMSASIMEETAFISVITDSGQLRGKVTKCALESIFVNIVTKGGSNENDTELALCAAVQLEWMNDERFVERSVPARTLGRHFGTTPNKWVAKRTSVREADIRWSVRQGHEFAHVCQTHQEEHSPHSPRRSELHDSTIDTSRTLSFFGFLHCLLAVALYLNPNPLLSYRIRVEQFLTKDFLPGVIGKLRSIPQPEQGDPPAIHDAWLRQQTLLKDLTDHEQADVDRLARRRTKQQMLHRQLFRGEVTQGRPSSTDSGKTSNRLKELRSETRKQGRGLRHDASPTGVSKLDGFRRVRSESVATLNSQGLTP